MEEFNIPLAQLHGDESPQYCAELGRSVIKAIRVRDSRDLERMAAYQVSGFVLDAFIEGKPGGTGVTIDWDLAAQAQMLGPIILAGGLTPDNVLEAVRQVRPYAVDVTSGVEASPGKKDHVKVRAFITNEIGKHTSELQSRLHLVCRLLLEKKKKKETDKSTRR